MAPQKPFEKDSFYGKEFYSDDHFLPASDEDCLFLNIWAPKERAGGAPVAIWIHGGAFDHGFGSEMEFDGEAFARRGVVLVTVNYRVGVLGFLAHPALSQEQGGHSGNYGILDQIAALEWVRENISSFGGDPQNITLFGQSAGAMSVQTLVSSPLTEGKIAKAIMQSGGGYDSMCQDLPLSEAEKTGEKFARYVGATLEELRRMPAQEVAQWGLQFAEQVSAEPGAPMLIWLPVQFDGYVMPKGYRETVDLGLCRQIPYMAGCTSQDIGTDPQTSGEPECSPLLQGCVEWCKRQSILSGEPNYAYYFQRCLPGDDAGAFHSSELWYIFGTLDRCWRPMTDADRALSQRMTDAWCAFMHTGDPDPANMLGWRACTSKEPFVYRWDIQG